MKINFITTIILASIGLIADIVTISTIFVLQDSKTSISGWQIFGLYLIGVLIYFSLLHIFWERNIKKDKEDIFWLYFIDEIILKVNLLVLSPLFILTIVYFMSQSYTENILLIFFLMISLGALNQERDSPK